MDPRTIQNSKRGENKMRKKIFLRYFYCLAIAIAFLTSGIFLYSQRHPSELKKPEEIKFKPPAIQKFKVAQGITVYYLEDKELPTVNLIGYFKGGSLYEPADKTGLAGLTGTVMRTGGTKKMTGDEIDEELEFLAARVETSFGSEFGTASLSCMKKDFSRVLEIYADILTSPMFTQEKIDLAKNQMKESIRRRWDMPATAASLLFTEKLYGTESPYARRITFSTLDKITREDAINFHQKYLAPNNLYLGIAGNISLAEVRSSLNKVFKDWSPKKIEFPSVPEVKDEVKRVVYYAYKDTPQANIALGHLGVRRNNPDQYKLEIMNYVLGGGGFGSRLMRELRSNRGLTYGIYGGVMEGRDRGAFRIASTLRAEALGESLTLIEDIINSMQANLIRDDEMEEAKNSMINSFVFRFESKLSILSQKIILSLMGYPEDYLEKYIENIKRVSKEYVIEAAKKYMEPGRMIIVIVGDKKRFDKPLENFGPVEEINLQTIIERERGAAPPVK